MSDGIRVQLDKALVARESARLLLVADDIDGAVNRAYFAMFHAAKAALLAYAGPDSAPAAKMHSGLIAAFGRQLVKPGTVSVELGRLLNRAEELRLVADYRADVVQHDDASQLIDQAVVFVDAIVELVDPDS